MVDFVIKDVTWAERKQMRKVLEDAGLTLSKIVGASQNKESIDMPSDFAEMAFRYGIEGYDTDEKLNELNDFQIQEGAMLVYFHVFFKTEIQKKS